MKLYYIILAIIYLFTTSGLHAKTDSQRDQDQTINYEQQSVTFKSGENTLSGILFVPQHPNGKSVTLVGPVGYVKEQAPMLYARQLASLGYTALIFDPTYHGQSEGEPRRFENGEQKTRDIIESVNFLTGLEHINPQQIYGLGICQGVNWMIRASNRDARINAVSLVAGHYLHPDVATLYNGGPEGLADALEKARQAKIAYESKGEVEYVPIVGSAQRGSLLTAPAIYDWYIPWENNKNGQGGLWENRITRMSILDIWGGNTETDLKALDKPTLVIHSDKAASGPKVPRQLFQLIPADTKELIWFEDQFQTMFYDDMPTINRAVGHIDKWIQNQDSK